LFSNQLYLNNELLWQCCSKVTFNLFEKKIPYVVSFQFASLYIVQVLIQGGTIDIVVHKVCNDRTLEELHQANGGNWGGSMVDKAFQDFLTKIIGHDVMKMFKENHREDFLDLERVFEIKKRSIKPDLTRAVQLKIPVSLSKVFHSVKSESLIERIEKDNDLNGKVKFTADKVLFDCTLFKNFFSYSIDHLVQYLNFILRKKVTKRLDTILMVGGFSESSMLFEAVESSFNEHTVFIPDDAGLSVLKGAVIFGHVRKDISSRISPFTYGFKMYNSYNPKIHPEEMMSLGKDGSKEVRGCFEKLVKIGDKIPFNEISRKTRVVPHIPESAFCLQLYASKRANPIFVTEPDCFKIGEIEVNCKDEKCKIGSATVQLMFGGTEIEVQAILESTGTTTRVAFSFFP
jgi:hypothetical protein